MSIAKSNIINLWRKKKRSYSPNYHNLFITTHIERKPAIIDNMPPTKVCWGDIPNESDIEVRDVHGKWIHCKICNVRIRIRAQYSLTEWKTHLDSVRHNELSNSKVLRSCQRLTDFFPKNN